MTNTGDILVVDDSPVSLKLLKGILTAEGYPVRTADSGELALASAASAPPELILLDIRMPGMDGFEVLRRLRDREETRGIPIMFISAATEMEQRLEGLKLGAVDFISKPFERQELLARVHTHVELFRLRARLEHQTAELLLFNEQLQSEIAERKLAEDALKESRERLDLALKGADLGLWDWNVQTGKAVWNRRAFEMLGYAPGDLDPDLRTWKKLVHPDDWPRVALVLNQHLKGLSPSYEGEYRIQSKTGEWKWILSRGKVVEHDSNGKPLRIVGTTLDVTERVRAGEEKEHLKAQLFQAQKMESVGTLAGGIAHDFNNLLTIILGYSEMLLEDRDEKDPAYADLQKIIQTARSGAEVVQRLLVFSRKAETNPVPLDLNRQVRNTGGLLSRTLSKMIRIEMRLEDGLKFVSADPTQMDQIVMNLAINAKEAMPDGGVLSLETSNVRLENDFCARHPGVTPGDYVLLSVSDTGKGMDKKILDRIFDPFFTVKGWDLRKGTGLGLPVVFGIVQQHGGCIEVLSEVGKGTTFKIYFPALVSELEAQETTARVMPSGGPETILLVDDEEHILELGKRVLSKAGYTVFTAKDGREALELYKAQGEKISLVILDLIMPEMEGKQCLKELLKINPEARVLVASGYSADGPTKEALEGGAKGFVSKPFDMGQLLQTVCKVLDET
jgi:PAS domain S-box-containing protein